MLLAAQRDCSVALVKTGFSENQPWHATLESNLRKIHKSSYRVRGDSWEHWHRAAECASEVTLCIQVIPCTGPVSDLIMLSACLKLHSNDTIVAWLFMPGYNIAGA